MKNKGYGIGAALILLAGAEIVARVFWADNVNGRFDYGYHPTAGFVEKGDKVELVRAGGRRFREQSMTRTPESGTLRIFVVGDSVPRGPSLKDAYIYQLAGMLREEGISAEGCNLAVAGYGSRRCHLVLKQALNYHPGLVILHLNDSNEFEDEREYARSQEFNSWHPKNWLMKPFIFRRLYEVMLEKAFWKMLPSEVRSQAMANDADVEAGQMSNPETMKKWRERASGVATESIRMVMGKGIPLVLVLQSRNEKQPDGSTELKRNDFLEDFAAGFEGPGVVVVSMFDMYQAADPDKEYADSAHLRAIGHRRIASTILQAIEQQKMMILPPKQLDSGQAK